MSMTDLASMPAPFLAVFLTLPLWGPHRWASSRSVYWTVPVPTHLLGLRSRGSRLVSGRGSNHLEPRGPSLMILAVVYSSCWRTYWT